MSKEKKTNEEDIKIYEETVSIDRSRQKSRKIFVFYIVGLFCVALVLILVSYVMQAHANQQLEDLGAQLTQQTDAVKGAKAKADQMQETIDAMTSQLDESKKENEELKAKTEEQEKAIDALNQLWQLEQAYRMGEDSEALELIAAMDKAYTREILTDEKTEPLTGDAAKEYAEICSILDAEEE
ncbi:MAG: hypothetical protein LUE11_03670 [Clostridia bacterium]|nr:hypothetical protein [Clostridia bacterium]